VCVYMYIFVYMHVHILCIYMYMYIYNTYIHIYINTYSVRRKRWCIVKECEDEMLEVRGCNDQQAP